MPSPKPLRYKRRGKCAATGKLRYRSQIDAGIALGRAIQARTVAGNEHVECRTYRCPSCGDWHLTSKPQRPA